MPKVKRVEISPDPTLMEDIGAASFTVADAIVELIANSMDARIDESPVEIEVSISPNEIAVVDDGEGMEEDILAEAVRLGVKMDQVRKSTKARKGMYGLGLKTAAASLGRYWAVHTRPRNGKNEFRVEFDLEEWRRQSGNKNFKWEILIEQRSPDRTSPLGSRKHGTAIVARKLRDRNAMTGSVLAKLGHAYRPHLNQGDVITVNGERALAKEFTFIEDSKHEIDLDMGDGNRITGWVALDNQTHNDNTYGINLYRQNQLIESWNKDWFKAHLMTSRIIGEVHLDFVDVEYTKQGFEKTTVAWKAASAAMTDFLNPVVRASREMSRGKKDNTRVARAVDGLNRAMGATATIGELTGGTPTDESNGGMEDSVHGQSPNEEIEVEAQTIVIDGTKVHLSFIVEDLQSEHTPWDYMYDDQSHEFQAVVNSNALLFRKVKDEAFLGMLALADTVAAWLTSDRGFDSRKARLIRDKWLHAALADE
jgi:hypothetical protein